ncbi:MAG: hypothetical protein NZ949_02795, partial [Candidatus Kapabacteria bacterium]|nr:hypothetical protein [Candidatus Kapabacteria bacterium]MDW7997098.1 hypothetical protein [Bacteroidota bacterium]
WTGIGSVRFAVAVSHFGLPFHATGILPVIQQPMYTEGQRADFREFAPPTTFRIGIAGEVLHDDSQRWTWALSLEHPSDNAESYAVASEYAMRFSPAFPAELLLRAGLRARAAEWWGAGVGLQLPLAPITLQLDYALSTRFPLGLIHRIGCSIESL